MTASVAIVGSAWALESIAPGVVTEPLRTGLQQVAPLLILVGIAAVILWLRN